MNIWEGIIGTTVIFDFICGNLTGKRYLEFLTNELPDLLDDVPLNNLANMPYTYTCTYPQKRFQILCDCDIFHILNAVNGEKTRAKLEKKKTLVRSTYGGPRGRKKRSAGNSRRCDTLTMEFHLFAFA